MDTTAHDLGITESNFKYITRFLRHKGFGFVAERKGLTRRQGDAVMRGGEWAHGRLGN
jgi:hypothetical protein